MTAPAKTWDISPSKPLSGKTRTIRCHLEDSMDTEEGMLPEVKKDGLSTWEPKKLGQPLTTPLTIKQKCLLSEILARR